MRVAIVNEDSQKAKNKALVEALKKQNIPFINAGMQDVEGEPELSYLHTGIISALLLNAGSVDYVFGGCGTGQGYMNCVMQFPGVFCGIVEDPLDAWLFRQINGGNCLSLALAKGYGWAGEINVEWIVEKFFSVDSGAGFPAERKAPQKAYRDKLAAFSDAVKKTMPEILQAMPFDLLKESVEFPGVKEAVLEGPRGAELWKVIDARLAAGC